MSTVIVMKCVSAENHPKADALRLYQFSPGEGQEDLQIIANLENVYEVGDHAIIANIGCILKEDNLNIKPVKIRGVPSYGMAMGKTDKPVGTDLTDEYCIEQKTSLPLKKWPEIESLSSIRQYMVEVDEFHPIDYRPKVKIDGANTSVHVKDGTVMAQSRVKMLTVDDDLYGFAKWVDANRDYWSAISDDYLVVFGEWAGKGIQKRNVAVANVGKKFFAVFAVYDGKGYIVSPEKIRALLPEHEDVYVLPWADEKRTFDFTDRDKLRATAEHVAKQVAIVEECDPWVKSTFGLEGTGEGLVYYPLLESDDYIDQFAFSNFVFKAKGEKHKVKKTKKPVPIDPEVAESIAEFIDTFVTENRLEQMATELGCGYDMKKTGQFIKLVIADVQKESVDELKASKLEWKDVAKPVNSAAVSWWRKKCEEI